MWSISEVLERCPCSPAGKVCEVRATCMAMFMSLAANHLMVSQLVFGHTAATVNGRTTAMMGLGRSCATVLMHKLAAAICCSQA